MVCVGLGFWVGLTVLYGAIQVLHNAMGGVKFPGKKRNYEDVQFNVITV